MGHTTWKWDRNHNFVHLVKLGCLFGSTQTDWVDNHTAVTALRVVHFYGAGVNYYLVNSDDNASAKSGATFGNFCSV